MTRSAPVLAELKQMATTGLHQLAAGPQLQFQRNISKESIDKPKLYPKSESEMYEKPVQARSRACWA